MKTTIIALVGLLATTVSATYNACPDGLYSLAECCFADVLGGDYDCTAPPSVPLSASSFGSICAASGKRARCCVPAYPAQVIICTTPPGVIQ
ncbi:hydrophobin 2 [Xylariaceae sp. AK1471]|nr:hydrophobin 2 [Xylariaceae sp. AK1471]